MNLNGDILLIEDDADDRFIMKMIFDEVIAENNYKNRLVILPDSTQVIDYLRGLKQKPFMLISDINMPKVDGLALRKEISADEILSKLCIPYLFLTTSGENQQYIDAAYDLSVQGYFSKPSSLKGYKKMFTEIMMYWKTSKAPAN